MGTQVLSVLVADDNSATRDELGSFLKHAGHSVQFAGNGDQVIQAVSSQGFDVILLDIIMPEKDGIETIRALRKSGCKSRMIAVLDRYNEYLIHAATEFGASAILERPFGRDALLGAVECRST